MALRFRSGDLFRSRAQLLTCPVNCQGVMGAGLALAFRKRFPGLYEAYALACREGRLAPGRPLLWRESRPWVLLFPTRRSYRDRSRLEDIEQGLRWLADHYRQEGIRSIAIPALGCGLGGLPWPAVRELVERWLRDLPGLQVEAYLPTASVERR